MPDQIHLDDEALSAVLDGEATPDESFHADGCATCTARLGELRDASLVVSSPVPPPDPARRESAIAAALAGADACAVVVPLRRRTPPAWLAAAAAVVIAVGAIALARGGSSSDHAAKTAAESTTQANDSASGAAGAPFSADQSAAAPVDGGALGELTTVDLKAKIDDALRAREPEAATPAPSGRASVAAPCESDVRAGNPDLGSLVFHATGAFHDEPVVVLAFDVSRPNGSTDRWVYVLATDGCAIRNQQTYAGA